ncbi:MAG: TonB-dependent receptor [Sphingomonas sp.]|nr:TonB-dependent receptor [Sphingomonas sp.]
MIDFPVVIDPAIVVTASRAEEQASTTAATVSLIDAKQIEHIGAPMVSDLLRNIPSVSVATSGPAGSLTQVRIRGAEATHSLLFIEGIRANDPAAGNEPRFELLNADLASRIEIIRGPQSALWGSEAIGGVIAVTGDAPGSSPARLLVEGGSFGTWRGAARTGLGDGDRGLSFGIAGQKSEGIDSFGNGGDRDGYRNIGFRASGRYSLSPILLLGASGFALMGKSEFDGLDPVTFRHADTLDETSNRLAAGRLFVELGERGGSYARGSASLLGSSNRNELDDEFLNRTRATRRTLGLEAGHRVGNHRLILALESERETFRARDEAFGGFTEQDRSRAHHSIAAEWKWDSGGMIDAALAVRHDIFSRFRDATSLRASTRAELGGGWSLAASYGEGIAQPTFFDLYGFFPGSFVGNPGLKPETSRGGEISLRHSGRLFGGSLTYFRQRLSDEIIDEFDPQTFLSTTVNADGKSRRQGIEAEAFYHPSPALRIGFSYAWLDASELPEGGKMTKEPRRPAHGASFQVDGERGRLSYGAVLSYSGARFDTDFDLFPAQRVRLDPYWLASARIAYRLTDSIAAHLRVANAFNDDYQDAVGYRTEGRSVHAGLRFALGG